MKSIKIKHTQYELEERKGFFGSKFKSELGPMPQIFTRLEYLQANKHSLNGRNKGI